MTAREQVSAAFKAAKISNHKTRDSYMPVTEDGDNKIDVFTCELEKAGFTSKTSGREYELVFSKDNVQVLYSARFGVGYQAILWIRES